MEVAPGIHRLEAPLGERFVALFLLVGDERALLIDTGLQSTIQDVLVPYLKSIDVMPERIRFVINTHADFDHMGGNAALKAIAPEAIFMCHELDRPMIEDIDLMIDRRYGEFNTPHGIDDTDETKNWIRENAAGVPIDLALSGGEHIRLAPDWSVEVLHTPGHSWGHLSIYDARSRSAIITDAALWNGVLTKQGEPAFPPTYRYVDTYLASNQRFRGMRIDQLLTSHYPVYQGPGVAEFLSESQAYADRVDTSLRNALMTANEPLTMQELIATLAPQLGAWPEGSYSALVYPFSGHLERLAQYGLVELGTRDGRTTYRWKV